MTACNGRLSAAALPGAGEKVYTTEVESVLYAHPAVLEAAVYAAPDPTWGERVCAAIVLRAGAGATAADIESYCRERLAGYKIPRTIHFLPELPRTGSGKILKRALRDAELPPRRAGGYRPWAELLARTFSHPINCISRR